MPDAPNDPIVTALEDQRHILRDSKINWSIFIVSQVIRTRIYREVDVPQLSTYLGLVLAFVAALSFSQVNPNLPTQNQGAIDKAIKQLPPGDRQAAESAIKQLPPSDQKALSDKIAGLSDEEKRSLANRIQQMSAKEREGVIARAEAQLKGRGPTISHVVEGPGLPPSFLVDARQLMGILSPPLLPENTCRLVAAGRELMPNIASFVSRRVDKYTERGVGSPGQRLALRACRLAQEL